MNPFLNKLLEKGYEWLLSLINKTDHSITKISLFLQEKKKVMEDYMIDRGKLLDAIKNAQQEIDVLHKKINETNSENAERLFMLFGKLESRTQELMQSQQEINNLHSSINKSRRVLKELANEREQAVQERNYLRSEYDHLQKIIEENKLKQEELRNNINSLHENNENGLQADVTEKIGKHEETIEKLQQEKNNYEQKSTQLQMKLKEKMILVSKLSGQLQQTETELRNKQELASNLEQKNNQFKLEIREYKIETKRLKSLINENKIHIEVDKQRIIELERVKSELDRKLEDANTTYLESLMSDEEKIKNLQEELLTEQNNLAIERERKGAPAEITAEALRILEQEYEPRFKTLYNECNIEREFYSDFFSLVPSDRLKVEACIVNLNFHYNLHMAKVRPNTVTTNRGTTIDEYPFGKEGRIYFRKDKRIVNFYRISRTKNGKGKLDQDRVIAWLQRNK